MSKQKILLVDDCKSALAGMQRCLCNWHDSIVTAENAKSALELLEQHEVAIIVSDYKLPDLNGIDLLERSKVLYPNCRRVLLTGFPDLYSAINAVNRGEIYRFLTKPYNPLELKEIISDTFDPDLVQNNNITQRQNLKVSELEASYPGIGKIKKTPTGAIEIKISEQEAEEVLSSFQNKLNEEF